ncbi:DUF4190 domain-containing protein [Mycobacterium sp. THU-M104]|uniref:DUF4190 domain-containing protein n=1 Tax=Mycobacterium sp. THU-M104 TaxID=3410515 RepID=UPI003B9937D3
MSSGDQGADSGSPFDVDPFGTAASLTDGAIPSPPGRVAPLPAPPGEVSTLATLSVVFAFVFAPAGAVLGHLALSRIRRFQEPGHRRAVLGLTLSYVFITLAVIVLIVWLLFGADRDDNGPVDTPTTAAVPSVRSTVVTAPPSPRPRVNVADLHVGDCVEIQKNQPDPARPNTDQVYVYRSRCENHDGVFQVSKMTPDANQCPPGEYLANDEETIIACFVKYGR